jgi:hypothetical protein
MTKLEAGLAQLANKAASGDIKPLREVIKLREKLQEQESIINLGPTFQIQFIHPRTQKPVIQADEEKMKGLNFSA